MTSELNIALVHGAWADGSSWGSVIPMLLERGHTVTAVQLPLTSFGEDVLAARRVLMRINAPTLLVGHSYGGAVITEAGNHRMVMGLVYVAGFAPEEGESLGDFKSRKQLGPGASAIRADADGFLWIEPSQFREAFAGEEVSAKEAMLMATVQKPIAEAIFGKRFGPPAWEAKPSWYLVTEKDRQILPEAQLSMARISPRRSSCHNGRPGSRCRTIGSSTVRTRPALPGILPRSLGPPGGSARRRPRSARDTLRWCPTRRMSRR